MHPGFFVAFGWGLDPVTVEAEDIINLIRDQVEKERREKISINNVNQHTKESATTQLIVPSQQPPKQERETSYKIATTFGKK